MFFDAYLLMTKCNKENKASIWRRSWRRRDFKEKMGVCSKEKMIAICKWRPAQHSEEKGISKAQSKFRVLKIFFFKQYKPGFLKVFKKIWKYFQAFQKFENKFKKKFVHCGRRGGNGTGITQNPSPSPRWVWILYLYPPHDPSNRDPSPPRWGENGAGLLLNPPRLHL